MSNPTDCSTPVIRGSRRAPAHAERPKVARVGGFLSLTRAIQHVVSMFAQLEAVLAGDAVVELDAASTKVLYFMLHVCRGCDATLVEDRFFIQQDGSHSRHFYRPEVAPAVVTYLLRFAPEGRLRAGLLPWWWTNTESPYWGFGPRTIWWDRSPGRVVIMIRDADAGFDPRELPPPIESPPPEYVAGAHACPHCGVVPDRYRKLSDGSLVCLACGRSLSRAGSR